MDRNVEDVRQLQNGGNGVINSDQFPNLNSQDSGLGSTSSVALRSLLSSPFPQQFEEQPPTGDSNNTSNSDLYDMLDVSFSERPSDHDPGGIAMHIPVPWGDRPPMNTSLIEPDPPYLDEETDQIVNLHDLYILGVTLRESAIPDFSLRIDSMEITDHNVH